jgi:pyrimidine operon attenuation protein / uracil phosphoribosyltransferase
MENNTLILTHLQIEQKLERIAWQIYETHSHQKEILLIGVLEKGAAITQLLAQKLQLISGLKIELNTLQLNKNAAMPGDAKLTNPSNMNVANIVLVDDVLNSGRTMLMALQPIIALNPASITTVVLANRSHRLFPVSADIVGITLSTTLHEHIQFRVDKSGEMSVWLD